MSEEKIASEGLLHDEEGRMLLDGRPFTGTAVEHWQDGTIAAEVHYEEGLQHGLTIGWHPNGVKREETTYVHGNARGIRREWFDDGSPKLEEEVGPRGVRLAYKEFDRTGQIIRSKP